MSVDKRSTYATCDDIEVICLKFGIEQQEAVCVNSYIKGVDAVRQDAITRNDFAPSDSYYPGIRSKVADTYTVELVRNFSQIFEGFFGLKLKDIKRIVSRYSIVTFQPEELGLLQRIPHFDALSRNSIAIVHYLCDKPDSGTTLYRHRKTGFEYVDNLRIPAYMKSVEESFNKLSDQPSEYICGSTEEYEEIDSFEAVYNRVVMYRGTSLHSGIIGPDYSFDPNPKTGRLTAITFIQFD